MESYRILPPNCAFRKVLQLVVIRPQEFFAAVRLLANWSICVIWWNAVREHPPLSALYSPKMPTHLDNEQSIVAAAQSGDPDAFVTLMNQYSRHIYRLGLSITGNHQDAEDVLQESSLKTYRAIAEVQGNSRFYTWLVRIAVNVTLGKLRKRALWKESSLDESRESEDGSYIPLEIESWSEDPEKASEQRPSADTFGSYPEAGPKVADHLHLAGHREVFDRGDGQTARPDRPRGKNAPLTLAAEIARRID